MFDSRNEFTRAAPAAFAAVVASALLAGCGGGGDSGTGTSAEEADDGTKIALRASRLHTGPWDDHLSLKLGAGGQPSDFYLCATIGDDPRTPCLSHQGTRMPTRGTLRLEQSPTGPAVPIEGSSGWGTVGSSDEPQLRVVLSDFVSGSKARRVSYRVTLHTAAGKRLATSNTITVDWRR